MKDRVISISLAVMLTLSVGLIGCGGEEAPEVTQYNLTASSTEGGSVTAPGEGTFTYDAGTAVELVAEADEGYQFVKWSGDVDTIGNVDAASTSITVRDNYGIIANFEAIPPVRYNLTISSTTGGSVTTPGEGTFTYDAGTVVSIVAARASGHRFVNWTGDVDHVAKIDAASTTITMNSHYSVVADFVETVEIWDWYDLDAVRDNLNGDYLLVNDLDSSTAGYGELASAGANSGAGWQPIGRDRIGEGHPFVGRFGGQGHEIRDLCINRPNEDFVALFGSVAEEGVIRHLGVVNAAISGSSYVGPLVGENGGSVSDSYCRSSIVSGAAVGGLIGVDFSQGTVSNSYYNYDEVLINGQNTITIGALFDEDFEQWLANDRFLDINERLSKEAGYYVINNVSDFRHLLAFGQDGSLRFRLKSDLDLGNETDFYIPYLAGEFHGNNHRILNLNFDSSFISHVGLFGRLAPGGEVTEVLVEDVDLIGFWYVGGLVGANSGTISNSGATGSVTGNWDVGGLVGINWGAIVATCHAAASVNSVWSVGGLVGFSDGGSSIDDSYATGTVTGEYWVGGLAGGSDGIIRNSYCTGMVTGEATVGGLVGRLWFGGTVINSYSVGRVSGGLNVGGLIGSITAPGEGSGIVSNSFWDIKASGQTTSAGGVGRTTAQMKNISTFSSATWNIAVVANGNARNTAYTWNIVDGQTYPFLSWQYVS